MSTTTLLYPVELPSRFNNVAPLMKVGDHTRYTMDLVEFVRQLDRDDLDRSAVGVYPWRVLAAPAPDASGRLVSCAFCKCPIQPRTTCYRVNGVAGVASLKLPRADGGYRYALAWSCSDCERQHFVHSKK